MIKVKKNYYNLHAVDRNNTGDLMSSVFSYFDFKSTTTRTHNLCRVESNDYNMNKADVIIAGGGGLFVFKSLEYLCKNYSGLLVGWGIGCNEHGVSELRYPDYVRRFDILGVRDWGTEFRWVPCPSCMHPCFDKEYKIEHEVIVYEHKNQVIDLDFPKKDNSSNFNDVIDFLGSGEIVLTNTYHGMYWATLLGRKVIAFPFSSRFYGMKYPIKLCESTEWEKHSVSLKEYPESLEECRKANMDFFEHVSMNLC